MDIQALNFGLSFAGFFATIFILGSMVLTPIFLILWVALQSEQAKKVFKVLTIISAIMFPVGVIMTAMIFYGFFRVNEDVIMEEMSYEDFLEEYGDDVKEEVTDYEAEGLLDPKDAPSIIKDVQ